MSTFKTRLKELRLETELTQKDIAEKFKLSTRGFQSYETGDREPKMSTLIALADFFDVSLDYLVGRSDKR